MGHVRCNLGLMKIIVVGVDLSPPSQVAIVLGSVAEATLRRAACSVLVNR